MSLSHYPYTGRLARLLGQTVLEADIDGESHVTIGDRRTGQPSVIWCLDRNALEACCRDIANAGLLAIAEERTEP